MKSISLGFLLAIVLGFANSTAAQIEHDLELQSENKSIIQSKNVIKFNILSATVLEHLEFSYERSISPRQSIEAKIGLIGIGIVTHEIVTLNQSTASEGKIPLANNGIFFSGGYKFFFSKLIPYAGERKTHILQGWYLQPEVIAGFYSRNKVERLQPEYEDRILKQKINYQAALANLGVQGVIGNRLVFDLFFGIGLGTDNLERKDDQWFNFGEFHRGLYKTNRGNSLATKGGIKIGLLF